MPPGCSTGCTRSSAWARWLATHPRAGPAATSGTPPTGGSLLGLAVRDHGVLLGAGMLALYVGLELGIGNWGFSYLVQARAMSERIAGYSISGYWLGLTLGRFLIGAIIARVGATTVGPMFTCLAGVTAAATLASLLHGALVAGAALMALGCFLGPIFPTTIAIVPRLTTARLAPTAIGVMNAGSVVGGSALPWLAGAITQRTGIWTLLPLTVILAVLQLAVWWSIADRIRTPRPIHGDQR